MNRWTHKVEPEDKHEADPKYMANGLPAYWVCHSCRESILLDGKGPPLTVPVEKKKAPEQEPPMSSQP